MQHGVGAPGELPRLSHRLLANGLQSPNDRQCLCVCVCVWWGWGLVVSLQGFKVLTPLFKALGKITEFRCCFSKVPEEIYNFDLILLINQKINKFLPRQIFCTKLASSHWLPNSILSKSMQQPQENFLETICLLPGQCKGLLVIFKQEQRLKRLITLGGLEIGIQHQIVNALELSTPHPPKKKINK